MNLDYTGPLYVKNIYNNDSNVVYKAWLVIITCASSRGIYLDLVPNCTSKSCIKAFRRFISNRGSPQVIVSDNGKYFTSEHAQNFVNNWNIKWKFNIEGAPWTGGFFERLIRSIKRCLKKILGNARLDYEQMLTIIKEIEMGLNNRAITYLYTESDLIEPVTPNKLLLWRNLLYTNTEHFDAKTDETSLTKRCQRTNILLKHFWNRWRQESITELREFNKIKNCHGILAKPNVNDVVLTEDENLKRMDWGIRKIYKLLYSKDEEGRSAEVIVIKNGRKLKSRRPVNKLHLFECSADKDEIKLRLVKDEGTKIIKVARGAYQVRRLSLINEV